MKRDLRALQDGSFDVAVIGGGIFGAFAAWDAAQRGLSVALVERSDFGAATSANSYKIVHGGIRYVQHGDVARVRESSAERRAFLRVAPHLVHPLPIVVPTYGHGMRGKLAMRAGMGIYDALTPDKSRGIDDPERRVEPGRMMGLSEVLECFPALERGGLSGAALFADGQMYNPPRLVLGVLKSAVSKGAIIANHVEATGVIQEGGRAVGVTVRDLLKGDSFGIRARVVLNAAGPYGEHLLAKALSFRLKSPGTYSRDACFVVPRPWDHPRFALAIQGETRDPDAIVSRGARHLFGAPWRNYSLIGTWHKVHRGDPNHLEVMEEELEAFVAEVNAGYRALELSVDDVSIVNFGLVPFGENPDGSTDLRYGHRSRLIDHAVEHGVDNFISLIGVRFTMGRREAQRAIDLVFRKLGSSPPASKTAVTPLVGGDIPGWSRFLADLAERYGSLFSPGILTSLAHNYGSEIHEVLASAERNAELAEPLGSSVTVGAQVLHALRHEMAQTLADVVFRRTDVATGEYPGDAVIQACGTMVKTGLGLSEEALAGQIEEVRNRFPRHRIRRQETRMKA